MHSQLSRFWSFTLLSIFVTIVSSEYWGSDDDVDNITDVLEPNDVQGNDVSALELQRALERYRVHTRALPWMLAVTECWREGGRLATPGDATEAQMLGRLLQYAATKANITNTEMMDAMHVGVYRFDNFRTFLTVEGDEAPYQSFFYPDIVHKEEKQLCVAVISDGSYITYRCDTKLIYACDKKPQREKEIIPNAAKGNNYTQARTFGWFKLQLLPLPWLAAKQACQNDNAELAVPKSESEVGFLSALFLQGSDLPSQVDTYGVFLGVNDLENEGLWRGLDGSHFDKWGVWEKHDNNGGRRTNCGALFPDGGVRKVTCNHPRAALCKMKEEAVYTELHGFGQYTIHSEYKNWMQAAVQCHSENASLVVINTNAEANVLQKFIRKSKEKNPFLMDILFAGVYKVGTEEWYTVEGIRRTTSFDGYSFLSPKDEGTCTGFGNGTYFLTSCHIPRQFICEKQLY